MKSFAGHSDEVVRLAVSPDGTRFASAGQDKTIRIWNLASGQIIHTIRFDFGTGGWSGALAFSPDGSRLASGATADGKRGLLYLWDVGSGRLVRNYTYPGASKVGFEASSDGISFFPDGRKLLSGGWDQALRMWDIESGRVLRTFGGSAAVAVALSQDGAQAISGHEKGMQLWDVNSGRLLQTYPHDQRVDAVAFSPDGKSVLSADGAAAKLWDAGTGRLIRTFGGQSMSVNAVAISKDGRALVSGGDDKIVRLWDMVSGRLIHDIGEHSEIVASVDFSGDGSKVAASGARTIAFSADSARMASASDSAVSVWDAASRRLLRTTNWTSPGKDGARISLWEVSTGRLVRNFSPPVSSWASWVVPTVNSIVFSRDGSRLLVGTDDSSAKLLETATGKVIRLFRDENGIASGALSPDGAFVALGTFATLGADKSVKLWAVTGAQSTRKLEGHAQGVSSVVFSPDGARVISGSGDASLKIWDAGSGQLLRTLNGHLAGIKAIAQTSDGRRLVSAGEDTTIRIWDAASGSLLLSVLAATNGEWIAITPEGFFAASEGGGELLSVVRGLEVRSISQFFQSLYRPDLVQEKLNGDERGLVREAAARLDLSRVMASGNAPSVSIAAPRDGERLARSSMEAAIDITPHEGGVGRVEWRINGVTVGIEQPPSGPQSLRLTRSLVLDEGENEIEVVVYNSQNLVASVPARATVTAPAAVDAARPRLFMLAVGLNEYEDAGIRLKYAVPDATAISRALGQAGQGLFESVHVTLLRDDEVRREPLDNAFRKLAGEVRPSDVFVFFIAGHGKTLDGRYYFIPQNFRLNGASSVVKQGIAQDEWQRWFASIPARKSVLLFDTCESGSLASDGFETRALERAAANDRLVQSTGRTVLTATSDTADAFEGYRGHGLFTYNLLEALGAADSDGNGTVELPELAAYVHAQVTSLSQKVFNRRQVPQVRITGNYPIAKSSRIFPDAAPDILISSKPTHTVSGAASDLLVLPALGARRVRKLDAKTPVTVVRSERGWTLVAHEGRPVGYIATRELTPIQ
ncbi:MAG: caspase family protein [Pseudorhodoplanes sp.]